MGERHLALTPPPPGSLRSQGRDRTPGAGAIVLVRRGVCTFVEKAKNVQLALHSRTPRSVSSPPSSSSPRPDLGDSTQESGGVDKGAAATGQPTDQGTEQGLSPAGGMVLLNGEDELVDMPAGNLLTEDIRIPVAM